jgi:hypothetical protein
MPMIVLDLFRFSYKTTVFFPKRDLEFFLNFMGPVWKEESFCVRACECKVNPFDFGWRSDLYFDSILDIYCVLPYKRQSSVNRFDGRIRGLKNRSHGLPWIGDYSHVCLSKMKNLSSGYKKRYVIVAFRYGTNGKGVLLVSDRYSDAFSLLLDPGYEKIESLLGKGFFPYNDWQPYVWVDYINNPVSLFTKISSYIGSWLLSNNWFDHFLQLLKAGRVECNSFSCAFGFFHKDKFSQIVCLDGE